MTIYDYTTKTYGAGNYGISRTILDQPTVVKRYIDTTVIPLSNGDTFQVIAYPADTVIAFAGIITDVVEGAAETADLLDDTSATTTLVNNHDLNTANTLTHWATGVFKASAGHVSILANAALTATKFWVYAMFLPVTSKD